MGWVLRSEFQRVSLFMYGTRMPAWLSRECVSGRHVLHGHHCALSPDESNDKEAVQQGGDSIRETCMGWAASRHPLCLRASPVFHPSRSEILSHWEVNTIVNVSATRWPFATPCRCAHQRFDPPHPLPLSYLPASNSFSSLLKRALVSTLLLVWLR